jgi:hypothetical protein
MRFRRCRGGEADPAQHATKTPGDFSSGVWRHTSPRQKNPDRFADAQHSEVRPADPHYDSVYSIGWHLSSSFLPPEAAGAWGSVYRDPFPAYLTGSAAVGFPHRLDLSAVRAFSDHESAPLVRFVGMSLARLDLSPRPSARCDFKSSVHLPSSFLPPRRLVVPY